MKEGKNVEFKETITNTFLKTVSAFANYGGGTIVFGVKDNGKIVGLDDPERTCHDIENKINDSISPQPDYSMEIHETERTVFLEVNSGSKKPYLYRSKAYKRNDTSTIVVDDLELTRLILGGKNLRFEQLPAKNQNLSFRFLSTALEKHAGVVNMDKDVLKTLELYSDREGYNNAAAILADDNESPGIDIAKFGDTINVIQKRVTFDSVSILEIYEKSTNVYRDYYQYERISETHRQTVERIPEAAFREAVANALIHRTWDVDAQIRISMFDDRIEVVSPGGLPTGISKEEYLSGRISILRNPILGNVFYRLHLVEIFGTGILRILQSYEKSMKKPEFEISENMIKVVLPVVELDMNLTDDENEVYRLLSKILPKAMSEIEPLSKFGRSKISGILKNLSDKGIVAIEGTGRGTRYRLK